MLEKMLDKEYGYQEKAEEKMYLDSAERTEAGKIEKDFIWKGIRQGYAYQNRYTSIPKKGLSSETAGGIWDLTLPKEKGKSIIRFDRGLKNRPHINIDPDARRSLYNPHIPIPASVVKIAGVVNTTVKYTGPILTALNVLIDAYNIGLSIKEDYWMYENAPEVLKELKHKLELLYDKEKEFQKSILECLIEKDKETVEKDLLEIKQLIQFYENLIKEVELINSKIPLNAIKSASSIFGSWTGGSAGAIAGTWAGIKTGSTIGSFLGGPPGATVGGFIGAVSGSLGGGIIAGNKGKELGEWAADSSLGKVYEWKRKDETAVKSKL